MRRDLFEDSHDVKQQNLSELLGANRGGFEQDLPGWGGGNRRPPRGGLGFGPQSDSSQEIYTSRRGKALPPFPPQKLRRAVSATKHSGSAAPFGGGFPTPPRKISSIPESDAALPHSKTCSALCQSLPGGTTEVSSNEPGLVSPKAGATERRKLGEIPQNRTQKSGDLQLILGIPKNRS